MRIGGAVIRAGAIGYTATHPDHRHQGLAAALMEDWTRELTRRGEHLSFVVGIPKFYEQFGYEFSFPLDLRDSPVSIDLNQLSPEETGMSARQFQESDLSALMALYEEENATRAGSLVRTDEYWEWLLQGLHDSGRIKREDIWLVENSDHEPLGYAMLHPGPLDELEIWEAAASGENVAAALLTAVATRARLEGRSRIDLKLPLRHLVTQNALSKGAYLSGYSSGIYARLLDLQNLFEAMHTELERRLRCSSQTKWQGTLRLTTEVGTVDLAIADCEIEVGGEVSPIHNLEIPQSMLVKLVTGYTNVRWVAGALNVQWMAGLGNAHIEQGLWPILQTLFPKGRPYIWNADIGY
jgi:predicted acetyltransferase